MQSVHNDSIEIDTSWGVNLVAAGAQVCPPTKQPDVLILPSQIQANWKALTTLSVNNSPVALWLISSFDYIQIYNKTSNTAYLSVKSEQRNVKRFGVE